MTFGAFLREQLRVIVFFLVGIGLMMLVYWFGSAQVGKYLSPAEVAYSGVLALIALAAYCVIEYVVRRPFYRDLRWRLSREMTISEGDVPLAAVTAEQAQYSELLKRYQDAYTSQLAELQDRQQFFETFATRFAHQMKTPITVIRLLERELRESLQAGEHRAGGSSQATDATEQQSTQQQSLLDTLAEECQRLEASVDAMLYTARLRAFSFDSKMDRVDVVGVLRHCINEHKAEWIHRKIYPKLQAVREAVYVPTDAKWLAFIVEQIVRNALQYGYKVDKQGQAVAAAFAVNVVEHTDHITIEFADEGIGIPERDIRHVFSPFYTGLNGRSHSRATGMGLYLVREVAERLGHRVSIESKVRQGTTVRLDIQTSDYLNPATYASRAT